VIRALLASTVALLASAALFGQQRFDGVCATVKIQILQELTIERIGFEATLEVTNNESQDPITDFLAELVFWDPDEEVGEDLLDVSELFFVRAPTVQNIARVDGTGVIGPTKTAVIRWFIIPKIGAGGTTPAGKEYLVGVRMAGRLGGEPIPEDVMFAIPETITVKPEPQLEITYFQPRDVMGDDPFTPQVESPVPFTLGVLVKNSGYGLARNVRIKSQQPRIVENKSGLLLVAQLLGARVMDSSLSPSLEVNLGDIPPGQTRKGAWDMITSLSGEFIEFRASYTHANDLGGQETSVIRSLNAYFILREVLNDQPGRDAVKDFLAVIDNPAELIPQAIYGSEGEILPVNHLHQASALNAFQGGLDFTLRVTVDFDGWGYVRIDDPGQGRYGIKRVVRSDGKVINPRNVWTSFRYRPGNSARLDYFHLLDFVPVGSTYDYAVEYLPAGSDTEPPSTRILFAGEYVESGGKVYVNSATQIYFISEDESPVSIFYSLNGAPAQPGLPFTLDEPGEYAIAYYARDLAGNEEAPKVAFVSLGSPAPEFAYIDLSGGSFLPQGAALSARPGSADFTVEVAPSPLDVEARVDVFAGVRAWPTLADLPVSPTPATSASLQVGGEFTDFYRYRLNGGSWSAERPVTQRIELSGLSGSVQIEVIARSHYGDYPPASAAISASWQVAAQAPDWSVTGVPASPARSDSVTISVHRPDVSLFRWTINHEYYRPEAPLAQPVVLNALVGGVQTLSLIGKVGTTWETPQQAGSISWVVNPLYGYENGLPLTLTRDYPLAQGQLFSFVWDGRNQAGQLVPAGWYTIRLALTDSLGRVRFANRLVRVQDLVGQAAPLAEASRGPQAPHARGSWAVWQDRASGGWNIAARRVGDPQAAVVAVTEAASSQENPSTDGRYVVWQARQPNGNWDIMIRDLESSTPLEAVTETLDFNEIRPVIEWPWVVFQRRPVSQSNAPWQLIARNLLSGESFAVDPTTQDQIDASIQGGRVVWQDWRDVGPGEIYLADLETRASRRITNQPNGQYHPSIFGDWIVWQDNRHGQLDLYGFDLLRSREVRLTETAANETRPRLQGFWVVYEEDSAGAESSNLWLMSLDSLESVPLTNTNSAKSRPSLVAGAVVWQDESGSVTEIRSAALPALQAVFRNANAVVVTPALAARYPDAFSLLIGWSEQGGVTEVSRYVALLPEPVVQSAHWTGAAAAGDNFPLVPGSFLWTKFGDRAILDLGDASRDPLNLQAGVNSLAAAAFPPGFNAYRLVAQLGFAKVRAVRLLDAREGRWRSVEVLSGRILGPDFVIPEVGHLFIELHEPVSGWLPE
jgi:beta propeller repeat protein